MKAAMSREEGSRWGANLMLGLWIAFPSLGFLQEHLGTWVLPVYGAAVVGLLVLGWRFLAVHEQWTEDRFRLLAWVFLVGMVVAHVFLHPFEDGRGPGFSSDRDEALEIAVGRLLDGEYPYYRKSEVAGPLSVLPGGILLAVPFVVMGKVGLINAGWLAGLLVVLRREIEPAARGLWLLVMSLAVSPAAMYEFVSGGDLIANAIYVALGCWFCLRVWVGEDFRPGPAVGAAVFLGVAVASRANFLLLCPLVVAWIWRHAGLGRALGFSVVTAGVAVGLIGGFYLCDPAGFTPFMTRGKLAVSGGPEWLGNALLGMTLLIVAGWAAAFLWSRVPLGRDVFFQACAWVTLAPLAGMIAAHSVLHGRLDFGVLHDRFGLMCLPFVLLGWGGVGRLCGALSVKGE